MKPDIYTYCVKRHATFFSHRLNDRINLSCFTFPSPTYFTQILLLFLNNLEIPKWLYKCFESFWWFSCLLKCLSSLEAHLWMNTSKTLLIYVMSWENKMKSAKISERNNFNNSGLSLGMISRWLKVSLSFVRKYKHHGIVQPSYCSGERWLLYS